LVLEDKQRVKVKVDERILFFDDAAVSGFRAALNETEFDRQ